MLLRNEALETSENDRGIGHSVFRASQEARDLTAPDEQRGTATMEAAERRRGFRILQHRPIKVFEPTTNRYFGGQTEDISSTGLRIELPISTPVRPGKLLSIHVGLNELGESLANRRMMIPARIVWVNRDLVAGHGRLTAGIEFISSIAAHLDAA